MTKNAFSKAKKIAMKFFGSEMTPPPFRKFSGNSSVLVYTGFPNGDDDCGDDDDDYGDDNDDDRK